MTKSEVLAAYNVNDAGIITSLGKFEGEMLYVPAMWAYCLEGCSSFDDGSVFGVEFNECDFEEFPEIGESYGMLLEESETGFVSATEYDTKEEYDAAVASVEANDTGDESV